MSLWKDLKKKGFKATVLKIPTRRTPAQIEHNMRTEFERARVIRTLNRMREFLDNIETSCFSCWGTEVGYLTLEISALIVELEKHTK